MEALQHKSHLSSWLMFRCRAIRRAGISGTLRRQVSTQPKPRRGCAEQRSNSGAEAQRIERLPAMYHDKNL